MLEYLGHGIAARFQNAVIGRQQRLVHALAQRLAPGPAPWRRRSVGLAGLLGLGLLAFHLGGLGLERGLGGSQLRLQRIGVHHDIENLLLVARDLAFGVRNFREQRLVLLVVFYAGGLAAELENLLVQRLDLLFVLAFGSSLPP